MRYRLIKIRTSPNWYVQWFEGRHTRRCSTGTSDDEAAEAFLAAFKLEVAKQPSEDTTLAQILDWYLETRGQEIVRLDSAELAVRHLKSFYGATLVDDVSLSNQERYALQRRARVSDETIRRELSVLSAAMNRAFKHEKIGKVPAFYVLPKSAARDRWLSRDEAARLLAYLRRQKRGAHLLLFTRLALYTGQRSGAILDLTWDRVDFARGMIHFPVPGRRQTNKRAGVLPMDERLTRMLKAAQRRNAKRKGGPVAYVVQWKGEQCGRVIRGFRRHAEGAGLADVTPHTLRHTFATWAAQAGQPLFLIGRTIGQSISATTERYAKHQPEALRSVLKSVRRK